MSKELIYSSVTSWETRKTSHKTITSVYSLPTAGWYMFDKKGDDERRLFTFKAEGPEIASLNAGLQIYGITLR